tara:strand:+ start:226 stop:477 length:252 start_codon:yes stop_codon:yes gene_type:complete
MNIEINILKKTIIYRLSYSGMKETDILYKKIIKNKLEFLDNDELILLSTLFNEISDAEMFNWLKKKTPILQKYRMLIDKISDE